MTPTAVASAEGTRGGTTATTGGGRGSARLFVRLAGVRIDLIAALGALLLGGGLWGSWLHPVVSEPLGAFQLPLVLPGGPYAFATWGIPVLVAVVLAVVGLLPWGRTRPVTTELAALLAVLATVGFVLQSCLVDFALQERLARERADLANLQLLVGYRIPRPTISTLGPVPLPAAAADVVSGLRAGFFLALIGAAVLAVAAVRRRGARAVRGWRPLPGTTGRRIVRGAVAAIVAVLALTALEGARARWDLRSAAASAATGDDRAAVASYRAALARGGGLTENRDVVARSGVAQLRVGEAEGAAVQLASSRLLLQAGKDREALESLASAVLRWPDDTTLRDEFGSQAFALLRRRSEPQLVHALVSTGTDTAVLRIALAIHELSAGDHPAAMADARRATELAADPDVRSIALTLLSVAQTRSGQPLEGRATLLEAVRADAQSVNVMARSLLAGLYTTVPL